MTFVHERLLYLKKICAHLRDVIKYEFFKRFGKVNFTSLCDFCFMRWAIPTGLIGANNAHNINSNLSKLSSDGYIIIEQVPVSIIAEIQNVVKQRLDTNDACGDIDAHSLCMISQGLQREILMTSEGESSCPLAKLARSRAYVELACNYLGLPKEKLIIDAVVDILNPLIKSSKGYDALSFHRDIDAYRFFKIFFYLKDCKEGEGHHEYLMNTHNNFPSTLVELRSYSQEEIIAAIPIASTIKMVGKSGFAFAENTIGFHRATLPASEYRLMATIVYMEDRFKKIYPGHFLV